MDSKAVRAVLLADLNERGAGWREEGGWIRFRAKRGGAVWETDCRCLPDELLIYGRYPFTVKDRSAAERECCRVNSELSRGAMFLTREGQPVYRVRVEMDDVYLAANRLETALKHMTNVLCRFWDALEKL